MDTSEMYYFLLKNRKGGGVYSFEQIRKGLEPLNLVKIKEKTNISIAVLSKLRSGRSTRYNNNTIIKISYFLFLLSTKYKKIFLYKKGI